MKAKTYRRVMNQNWDDEVEALIVNTERAIESANRFLNTRANAAKGLRFSSAGAYREFMNRAA